MNCPKINEEELKRVLEVLGNGTIPGSDLCTDEQIGGGGALIGLLWLFGLLTSVHPDTGGKLMGSIAVGGCNAFRALARITHNQPLKTLDEPGAPIKPGGAACLLFGGMVQEIASAALAVPYYFHDLMAVAKMLKSNNATVVTEIIDEVDRNITHPEFPEPVPFVVSPQSKVNNRTKTAVRPRNVPPPPPPEPSSDESPSNSFYALRGPENEEGPTPGYVYPLGYIEAILLGLGVALRKRNIPNPNNKPKKKLTQKEIHNSIEKYRDNFGAVPPVNHNETLYKGSIGSLPASVNYRNSIHIVPNPEEKYDDPREIWASPPLNRQVTPDFIVPSFNRKKTPNILLPNQSVLGGRVKTRKRRMTKRHHKKRHTRSKRA